MKLIFTCFVALFLTSSLLAQGWMSQGSRNAAMANSGVAFIDIFAYHHNPGALAFLKKGTAGVSYEARYMMKELQSQSIAVAVPLPVGVISVGGQFYGYNSYRTTRAGLGYSMKLSDNFSAGIQINYLGVGFGSTYYGRRNAVSAELGALARISDKINIGFSVVNLTGTKLNDFKKERFGTILRLGASYKVIDQVMITGEIEQEIAFKTRFRFGMEYQPIEILYIRAGVQGAPLDLAFGFGLNYKGFKLDLSSQYNPKVGWSPMASFIAEFYTPKKKTEK